MKRNQRIRSGLSKALLVFLAVLLVLPAGYAAAAEEPPSQPPSLTYEDGFDNDGDLSAWTVDKGIWEAAEGRLASSPTSESGTIWLNDRTYLDAAIEVDVNIANGRDAGLILMDPQSGGVTLGFKPGQDAIGSCKFENASCTSYEEKPYSFEYGQTYRIKLVVQGSAAKMYVDGELVWTRDNVPLRGDGAKAGIWNGSAEVRYDNFSIRPIVPDAEAPTAPGKPVVSDVREDGVTLSWGASADNEGVVGYSIYSGDSLLAETGAQTTYAARGLAQNASYLLTVKARDEAGNLSEASPAAAVKTLATRPGDALVHEGVEYTAKAVGSWTFDEDGLPWSRAESTWDGHNAEWMENPHNGGDKAIRVTMKDKSLAKSHVGQLGMGKELLAELSGKENYLVRIQFRRWQPAGWDGGSFLYWSLVNSNPKTADSANIEWKDGRDLTMQGGARQGETETYYLKGTDMRFVSEAGFAPLEVQAEWDLAQWSGGRIGESVYIDDFSWTVYADPAHERPAAPTEPVVDSDAYTFGWTPAPGYGDVSDYEYSLDSGESWQPAAANPQPVPARFHHAGAVQVRVKAAEGGVPGYALASGKAFPGKATRAAEPGQEAATLLWRIGRDDRSSAEFRDFAATNETVDVPADWSARADWSGYSKGMKGDLNAEIAIRFQLGEVPENGVRFSFRNLDAYKSTPQMGVYANGIMAGLVQIAGVNGSGATYVDGRPMNFVETYQVHVPKELLQAGENTLTLKVDRGLYATEAGDPFNWYVWDYVQLERLDEPAVEPLNGRYVHLGTNFGNLFTFSNNETRNLPALSEWMGIAYSGNWIRVPFWSGLEPEWQPEGRAYLETLRDLNLQPMMNYFGGSLKDDPTLQQGQISQAARDGYRDFVSRYGDLYQYLEVQNEPGLFGWHQKSIVALTELLREEREKIQPNLNIVAPGWAYWPSNGTPDGWERDPEQRRPIELLSDLTNGHSYGAGGTAHPLGSSLPETLRAYDSANGEIPKEMAMSETGGNDSHADNAAYGTSQKRFAAVFDREMRANIGYVDHIMQHAAFFQEGETVFGLFDHRIDWNTHRPEDTLAWGNAKEPGETRLKSFRRLATAYATHGAPLSYAYENRAELVDKRVLFRGVDTSGLGTSAVGASSDKLLLNFTSFDTQPVTMKVKVALPEAGSYVGSRYGAGESYEAAHEAVSLTADPYVSLTVTLEPGESVQYILVKEDAGNPTVPDRVVASAASYKQIDVSWNASEDDTRVAGYFIYRGEERINTVPRTVTSYRDFGVAPESTYTYRVVAFDDSGHLSGFSEQAAATTPQMPVTPGGPRYEAELAELASGLSIVDDSGASGGKAVGQTQNGALKLMNIHVPETGPYTFTIRYAAATDGAKQLSVEGGDSVQVSLPATGGWSNSGKYVDAKTTLQLTAGTATIVISNVSNAADIDYFELVPGEYVPQPEWQELPHGSEYIEYDGFEPNPNGASHDSSTAGASAAFAFRGTGFAWNSRIQSADQGVAEVYVDGELAGVVELNKAGLEGFDREVFRKEGLEARLHTVKIVVKSGTVALYKFKYYGIKSSPVRTGIDLTVTDVEIVEENPKAGDSVVLRATIKNIGTKPTEDGKVVGGVFFVDGGTVAWSDLPVAAIAPGQSAQWTANAGPSGPPHWHIDNNGAYTIGFKVNDIFRVQEMDYTNNMFEKEIVIGGPAEPAEQTAAQVAAGISGIPAPDKDATKLALPTVPAGFQVAIASSSHPEIVALNGTIKPPAAQAEVKLVLEVTRLSDESKASTAELTVIVPAATPTSSASPTPKPSASPSPAPSASPSPAPSASPSPASSASPSPAPSASPTPSPSASPSPAPSASPTPAPSASPTPSPSASPSPPLAFKDVTASHWASAAIAEAFMRGIIRGDAGGTFRPNAPVSRAELVTMLGRALGWQQPAGSSRFADKAAMPAYAAGYAEAAAASGVIAGYADGSFGPQRELTRAELAVVLARAAGLKPAAGSSPRFADAGSIPAWARGSVAAVQAASLMNGLGDGRFAPGEPVTRAQAAAVMVSLITRLDRQQPE